MNTFTTHIEARQNSLVPAYAWSSGLPMGKFDPAKALGGGVDRS